MAPPGSGLIRSGSGEKAKHQHQHQHFPVCFGFLMRKFKLKEVEPPQEIRKIFNDYSQNGIMSVEDLNRFLVVYQREEAGGATLKAKTILENLNHKSQGDGLNVRAFFRYLFGDFGNNGPLAEVQHDMNAPLAHYFLYSGHNSYLTGNQCTSRSSTFPIKRALKKGVRVIELDLWPNCRRNDVQVRHGWTMTPPVKLKACLKAIKDYAFCASEYPVVITFEDHITKTLQDKVAKMVDEVFGDMLYRPDPHMTKFPSPESLKKKVLISTKPPEITKDQGASTQKEGPMSAPKNNYTNDLREDDETFGYADLISIHAGKPPKGPKENWFIDHSSKARRLSLSEDQLQDVKEHATEIVRFTQNNLLRIYPNGSRVKSSNYDPMVGWMRGGQMVAFNMQGHGHFLRMMEGMFRANGGCGYVKKPDILLNVGPNNEVFNRTVQKTLQVVVYMGEGWRSDFNPTHFDCWSPPDFSVKVEIDGAPMDKKTETTTRARKDQWKNQWEPVWNQEFMFRLTVPELALLYIEVVDEDFCVWHDFGGQTCLPVSELRQGIRAVPLYDRHGHPYKSVRLLILFKFI